MATILLAPHVLEVLALRAETARITAVVRPRASGACCPLCGQSSRRVHSWYRRTVLDLPCTGITMQLDLRVRRFFCDTPSCARQIFTERLPDVVAPSARRT